VAAPVPIQICPLLPLLEEPALKISMPDAPAVPAFELRMVTMPLDEAVPSPLDKLSAPPVLAVLRPEKTCTLPPAPLVPLPTVKSTMPPRPSVAAPEPSLRAPLLPLLALPELKMSMPLLPFEPAFALRIETMPLDDAEPKPLARLSAPPVSTVPSPAFP
jgi:hypothetical protein